MQSTSFPETLDLDKVFRLSMSSYLQSPILLFFRQARVVTSEGRLDTGGVAVGTVATRKVVQARRNRCKRLRVVGLDPKFRVEVGNDTQETSERDGETRSQES